MAQNVVSCSSCGKKFRLPGGGRPADFECTGCGEMVSVGGGAAGRSRGPGVRDRRREAQARRGGGNTGLYLTLCGIGLVAVIVIVLVLVMGGDGAKKPGSPSPDLASSSPVPERGPADPAAGTPDRTTPGAAGAGATDPDSRTDLDPEPMREPERQPTRVDPEPEPEVNDNPRYMSWSELKVVMRGLEHLESTSASDRTKIDQLVALVMDDKSGGDGLRAQIELIKMGKPAVPMLLKAIAACNFETREERSAGFLVDEALRAITNYTRQEPLKPVIVQAGVYQRVMKNHYLWWDGRKHLEGADFPEKGFADEDEDE